jgi:hypothetical protein
VEVPEKFVVSFKPGKIMEERVNSIEGTPLAEQIRIDVASGDSDIADDDSDSVAEGDETKD